MESLYNDQDVHSPKTQTPTLKAADILHEVSPTGILGFPQSAKEGDGVATTSKGKLLVQAADMPSLNFSEEDYDSPHSELTPRFSNITDYWSSVEEDLMSGRQDYVVPRCNNPWQGFAVEEGYVIHRVMQWDRAMKRPLPKALPSLAPVPGPFVAKMVAFFEQLAQQAILKDACEPFVVYKRIGEEIRGRVEKLELLANYHPPTFQMDSPLIWKHVDPKLQSMVDWWNEKIEAQMKPPQRPLQRLLKKNNPRVVVMANLMQKKLENKGAVLMDEEPGAPSTPHAGHMVLQMVQLLEAINYHTKTGISYDPSDPMADHKHHVKPLPMVY